MCGGKEAVSVGRLSASQMLGGIEMGDPHHAGCIAATCRSLLLSCTC